VIAAANPLRSVAADAAHVRALLDSIDGPVVLVGHSYGGMVISRAAVGASGVTALVFVAAFAPEDGDSAATLSAAFPGSTLAPTLRPVPLPDGGQDLYVAPDLYHEQFAADLPEEAARVMAAVQRPITLAALQEAADGEQAWQTVPSSFVVAGPTGTSRPRPSTSWPDAPRAMCSPSTAPRTPSSPPTPRTSPGSSCGPPPADRRDRAERLSRAPDTSARIRAAHDGAARPVARWTPGGQGGP